MRIALTFFVFLLLIPISSFVYSSFEIPDWVRTNAGWWASSQISDEDFTKALEHLIREDVLEIPKSSPTNQKSSDQIPSWVRNTAQWWNDGLLSDSDFIRGMQYLLNNGIIRVSSENSECQGNGLCITAMVERIVDGDTIYVDDYKIRLALTNTPEKSDSGFYAATDFTREMCPVGSIVTIDQDDIQKFDKNGRLLANVYCEGKSLNSALLYNGHANILTQYCDNSEFSDENWAQEFGCGPNSKTISSNTYYGTSSTKSSQTSKSSTDCDPSYPDFCIPPPPPDLDCKDIPQKRFTVLQPDPHRFDGDKDGIGCES